MKKFLLLPILALLFISCEGPMGPPGSDGQVIVGQIFEVNVSFHPAEDYEVFVDIPSQIDVYPSDIVVAYILVDEFEGRDVWEPLPQTLFFGDETLLYGYDFTSEDVSFFLDGTVFFENLPSDYTNNIIFRVAVLPADSVQGLDLNNMENVLNFLNNNEVIKIN